MKKQLLLSAIVLLSVSHDCFSQATFQIAIGGTDYCIGNSGVQTPDGGYIVTGENFDFGADAYLIKTDSAGNLLWINKYGLPIALVSGNSVQSTYDGGYILCGNSIEANISSLIIKTTVTGNMFWRRDFELLYGSSIRQTHDSGYVIAGTGNFFGNSEDVGLIKTDENGDLLWGKTFGGTGDDFGISFEQTSDSGFIITGYTNSFGVDSADVYLIKTQADGDTLWTKTYGDIGNDYGYSVKQTNDGGYIVTGSTNSFGAGGNDVYLIKTDSVGDIAWTKTFGESGNDIGFSVAQTNDNGYIISGQTNSFGLSNQEVFLVRTDSNGTVLWTKTLGGPDADDGKSVQQTTDAGYMISGSTENGSGISNVLLIKTNSLGNTGCAVGNPVTITTIPATQVSSTATVVNSISPSLLISSPTADTGGVAAPICNTTEVNDALAMEKTISIFPNPSAGNFTITFPVINQGYIEIYSVLGEKIYSDPVYISSKKEIHIRNVASGIYFIKVFDGEKYYCDKIMIERN